MLKPVVLLMVGLATGFMPIPAVAQDLESAPQPAYGTGERRQSTELPNFSPSNSDIDIRNFTKKIMTKIDHRRLHAGLEPFPWNEPFPGCSATKSRKIYGKDLLKLRVAVAEIYVKAHKPEPTWTDPSIPCDGEVLPLHWRELVKALSHAPTLSKMRAESVSANTGLLHFGVGLICSADGTWCSNWGGTVTLSGEGSTVTCCPQSLHEGKQTFNCACGTTFHKGTVVTLTADAISGYSFEGWDGGDCSGTGRCSVTISEAMDIKALFKLQQ
jgi:hypothetical protein